MKPFSAPRFPSPLSSRAALSLGLCLVLAACGGPADQGQAPTPTVGVVTIKPQMVALDMDLPGRTSAYKVAEVRPQVGGIILKRQFTEGLDVREGQSLYQIDPATYRAAYDSAKANLAQAEANLTTLRLKAERYQQLLAVKAVGQQEYDDAAAAAKAAVATVQANRAALEQADINLRYTRVLAPVSGRIGKSSVTQGALVTADQATALTTVQQLDPIYVDVTRSSGELLQLKRDLADGTLKKAGANGAVARLILEDGSLYPLEGKLQFSDVTVNESTGAITLRAIFPNPKHELLPGMFVRARLTEGINEQAILVPQDAVTRDSKGKSSVYVVGADGKVQSRSVETPRSVGNQWLVKGGLKSGDKLVVDGLQSIGPGVAVKTVSALTNSGK